MLRKQISRIMAVVLVVSAMTFTPNQQKKVNAVASPSESGWVLQWSDEFDGNLLDTDNWSYNTGTGDWGWGNGEAQCYTSRTDNVRVSDGNLQLIAKRENYNGSSFTSGRINSKNKQFFQYGKMEARIKVENGNQTGIWPAFWMQGNVDLSWPARGELDIMEHRNDEDTALGTIHWGESNSDHHYWGGESRGTPYEYDDGDAGIEAWHTYGVTWDEDTIKWYVDDEVYQTAHLTSSNEDYFRRNFYFILNLALGSEQTPFTLYTTVPSSFTSATMYVDYVRAYSFNGTEETITAPDLTGYTKGTVDSAWHDLGAWQYYMGTWAGPKGYYKGGATLNDLSVYVDKNSSSDWGIQIKPNITLEADTTYNYSVTIDTNAAGDRFKLNRDLDGNGTKLVDRILANGINTYSGTFTTGSTDTETLKLDLAYLATGTTFTITSFSVTEGEATTAAPETTTPEVTTTDIPNGYTLGTQDSSWHDLGAWQYYLSSGANAKGAYQGGATLNNFSFYIKKKASYDWGTQLQPNITLNANTTYHYNIVVNTDAEGNTFKMNKDLNGDGTKLIEETLADGTNTFTGTFTTGDTDTEILKLDLAKLASGSTFTITSFSVTDENVTTEEITTEEIVTQAPIPDPYAGEVWKSSTDGSDYKICIVGEDARSEFRNQFQVEGSKLYIAASAAIIKPDYKRVTLNDTQLAFWQGAYFRFNISDLHQNADNIIVVDDAIGFTYTLVLRAGTPNYISGGEVTTEMQETTTIPEETTAANSDPYANLDWITVSKSKDKYQVACLEDFGIMSAYMNGSKEMLIAPYVNHGTYKIWPEFMNETYNGNSVSYSRGSGIHIKTNATIDNSYNIYSATSNINGNIFHIIVKAGTPAVPTTVAETTTKKPEVTTVQPTTAAPPTVELTTATPTTEEPTTAVPPTEEPTSVEITTEEPVTEKPAIEPVTEDSAPEADFKIASKTLALSSGISLVFKVNKSLFENRYSEPKVVVLLDGFETEITEYTDDGSRYAFEFTKITPDKMNIMVEATLHATKNGKEYVSPVTEYSVSTYVYNMLNKYGETPGMESFRTLLVDLLNYGAASQNYTGFNTDNPANGELTATQRSWASGDLGELISVKNNKYVTIDNPSVLWKSAGLALQDAVIVRMKIQADSTDGLIVRVTDDYGTTWDIEPEDFEPAAGTENQYYISFKGFNVGRMSESMYFTAYRNGTAASNTYRYSVESYVEAHKNDEGALGALVVAMMKYGKSAQAYIS